ncbi:hypothetical protein EON65_36035 [archaeon]|nr:MAG: hypothetical protein EON65_36035 [archaeon]
MLMFFQMLMSLTIILVVLAVTYSAHSAQIKTAPANYVPHRSVRDYGAKGDGVTDDTAAIIRAITENRGDDPNAVYPTVYSSSSVTPALVYFPAGTYLISDTLPFTYYTQLVGDADNTPVIKMQNTGSDKRLIDALDARWGGNLVNQNNFFHHMRNFVLDMSECDACTGIHWQVAQATQLSNIFFRMKKGSKCQGIWMENGSGGFVSDLVFEGGMYGLWVGNQQFTSRNITIRDTTTAGIYLNWDWGWTFKSLVIENSPIGIDVGSATGTLLVLDSKFKNISTAAVRTGYANSNSILNNNVILDNVILDSTVADSTDKFVVNSLSNGQEDTVVLVGKSGGISTATAWAQGKVWKDGSLLAETIDLDAVGLAPNKPSVLVPSSMVSKVVAGAYFEKARPAFDSSAFSRVNAVKDLGISNDGKTDVTVALQQALQDTAKANKILFLPYGTYLVSDTIYMPAGTRVLGEAWSVLQVGPNPSGKFSNASNPTPVFQVGKAGEKGVAQLVDLLITTQGPLPGAKLVEWNMADPVNAPGSAGMWEVHFRIGGAVGTLIDPFSCPKGDGGSAPADKCAGAWALMHITKMATAYLENVWGWVADHDLDYDDQINVYNARGLLVESQGPVWMYGTAFEHSLLYQYNFVNARNVMMAMIQTETPYFQPAPLTPFLDKPSSVLAAHLTDPTFCTHDSRCNMAKAVNVDASNDIFFYGTGLYSFFNLWDQGCLYSGLGIAPTCQLELNHISNDSQVWMVNLNTYGSVYMTEASEVYSVASSNMNTFCSTACVNLMHYNK